MAPRRVVREEKQQAIVAAAFEVFAARGFAAATIDEIARASGLGKGTIYEYFTSKEDLFFAVFRLFVGQLLERARALSARPQASAADRVRALILGLVDVDDDARRLFPLTFEFWAASASASPELRARVGRLFRDSYADLGRMLAETIRDGVHAGEFDPATDVAAITAVLVGSMDGLWLQAWFDPTLNPVRMAARFLDVVLGGLAAARRPGPDEGPRP